MNPGETVGHYRILSLLGSGGMGIVYLAEDLSLGRKIALKFLSGGFASNPTAVERFRREARAASALNHPSICTIHEISEHDGQPFIAMEHLEGQSLRDLLRERRISLDELLSAAIDVAEALDAAHRVGVVHRDIKPGNVFVLARNRAKLLDFGLAKMEVASSDVAMAPTREASHLTDAGITLGTVAYMSPEQARGDALDARSDLFSFGVLLYEAVTGVLPFRGSSTAVLFHEILGKTPIRPLQLNPDTPPDLDRLIMKALEKDRDVRCQSAAEMLSDLKRLKRDRDSSQPSSTTAASVSVSSTLATPSAATSVTPSSSSDVQVAAALLKKHGVAVAVAGIAAILGLAALVFFFVADRGPSLSAALPASDMQVKQITSSGTAARPAISPDGKFVAYISGGGLWVRQTETSSNVQIVPPDPAFSIVGMTISPDNNFVDFIRTSTTGAKPPLLSRVPLLGGTAKLLLEDVHSLVGWSPDGKRMAFVRSNNATNPASIVVADADGGNQTVLLTRKAPDPRLVTVLMPGGPGFAPAWSPNGGLVAYPTTGLTSDSSSGSMVFVNTSDKTAHTLNGGSVNGFDWLDDSSLLVARRDSNGFQLWRMSYPEGKLTRVTNDVNTYQGISVGAGRSTWVTSRTEEHAALWVGNATATEGTEIQQPGLAGVQHNLTWIGDRLVFSSRATIFSLPADGGQPEELLKNATSPNFTSDGKTMVYFSGLSNPGIWRADSNGRNPVRLFEGSAYWPLITADDKNVIYESFGGDKLQLWIVPLTGGDPQLLNPAEAAHPRISPDGKLLAFGSREQEQWFLSVCDLPACAQVRHVRPINMRVFNLQWMPDGRTIAYSPATGGGNIMIQPLDGSPERQLTHFTDGKTIYDYKWSPDGKRLAIARSSTSQDIVLFRNAKP
jgi:eukaryotic-like serine/threonine-protein kinase